MPMLFDAADAMPMPRHAVIAARHAISRCDFADADAITIALL